MPAAATTTQTQVRVGMLSRRDKKLDMRDMAGSILNENYIISVQFVSISHEVLKTSERVFCPFRP